MRSSTIGRRPSGYPAFMDSPSHRAHPDPLAGASSSANAAAQPVVQVLHRPCGPCPWVCANAERLTYPNLAEYAAGTIPSLGFGETTAEDPLAPLGLLFACHHDAKKRLCAAHVAVEGHAHPLIRLAIIEGLVDPAVLTPGEDWPELYDTYQEMLDTVGRSEPAATQAEPAAEAPTAETPQTLR